MTTKIIQLLDSWRVFVVVALAWGAWFAQLSWPTSWWMSVSDVHASETELPRPVAMTADRIIRRPFHGLWIVEVRRQTEGTWVLTCAASGRAWYRPASALPQNLTLAWWSNNQCSATEPGTYRIDTTWTITPEWLSDRRFSVQSNAFRVYDPAPQ